MRVKSSNVRGPLILFDAPHLDAVRQVPREKEITIIASPVDTSEDEEIDVRSDVDMGTAEEVTVSIACKEENTGIDSYPNDIGLWPNEINDTFRDYWLTRGNKECRNNDSDFKNSAKTEQDIALPVYSHANIR